MLKKTLLIMGVLSLTACSSSVNLTTKAKIEDNKDNGVKTNNPVKYSNSYHINNGMLSNIYREWVGTSYRFGGTTKRGIDCSAFVQTALLRAFNIDLPRSTHEQRHSGEKINKSELKEGDLVFFRGNKHVGIYIGNGYFMHSSSSLGVSISSLDEGYWKKQYTQSRRVI